MRKLFLLLIFFPIFSLSASAEESVFKLTFSANVNNIPIQIYKTNKNAKTIDGVKLYNWVLSPETSNLFKNDIKSKLPKNKNFKDIFYIKFVSKF